MEDAIVSELEPIDERYLKVLKRMEEELYRAIRKSEENAEKDETKYALIL